MFLLSGAVSLIRLDTAARELTQAGLGTGIARTLVVSGAVADTALAVALLWRRSASRAAIGMAGLSLGYLLLGSLLRPDYWSDPLAPLAKILPIIILALVASITLEER
ncbi:DoxX-like family protein [Sphingobium sp. CR28]|uniref:DoxX-like family protein n=1 Tax=Sphingobium sp. CR28 TaxID=3400272 RepID=UPI003FED64CF